MVAWVCSGGTSLGQDGATDLDGPFHSPEYLSSLAESLGYSHVDLSLGALKEEQCLPALSSLGPKEVVRGLLLPWLTSQFPQVTRTVGGSVPGSSNS